MKEVKFRAWDKNQKKMFYDGDYYYLPHHKDELKKVVDKCFITNYGIFYWVHETQLPYATEQHFDSLKYQQRDIEVMQFTGLQDKNGKEICKGDICKNGDWETDVNTYNYRIEKVTWNKDNGMWMGWNFNEDGMICEIIGNIYENPELLEIVKD